MNITSVKSLISAYRPPIVSPIKTQKYIDLITSIKILKTVIKNNYIYIYI